LQIKKKHIIAGVIAIGSIAAAAAYLQYKKLMDYCMGFKSLKINALTESNVDLDVFLNFKNNSTIKIDIISQEYNVYINDQFVTKASNAIKQEIQPESLSVIGVNIKFNPTDVYKILKLNVTDLLLHRDKIKIKIDMKLKVSLWLFTVSIPYTYEATLKDMMTPSTTSDVKQNKTGKCK
jgi:LEA14-like dessication related protein